MTTDICRDDVGQDVTTGRHVDESVEIYRKSDYLLQIQNFFVFVHKSINLSCFQVFQNYKYINE